MSSTFRVVAGHSGVGAKPNSETPTGLGVATFSEAIGLERAPITRMRRDDQRVPIPTVAGEARCLDREHGTHTALTNCGEQTFEPGAAHPGTSPIGAKIVHPPRHLKTGLVLGH